MPTAKVGDINMYYEVHGEGEPLVMIPGGGGGVQSMLPRIKAFTQEYQVVVFDGRGIGRSDASDAPYSIEMLADDLAGLLDAISIERAHVYGASARERWPSASPYAILRRANDPFIPSDSQFPGVPWYNNQVSV